MKRIALLAGLMWLCVAGWTRPVTAQVQPADSVYVVKQGDTLFSIARRFEVSVRALRQWNDLPGTTVQIGQRLRVHPPAAPASPDAAPDSTYTVRRGDTLYGIAREQGVSVRALRRWNDLSSDTVQIGQTLRIRPPPEDPAPSPAPDTTALTDQPEAAPDTTAVDTTAAPPDTALADADTTAAPPSDTARTPSPEPSDPPAPPLGRTEPLSEVPAEQTLVGEPIDPLRYGTHTIQPGDTFYSVAVRYGLSADTLFALNGEHTAPLPPGRVLRLPIAFAVPSHVVDTSETIYDVAAAYGVSARALQRANGLADREVTPGQRLRIPGRRPPDPPDHALPPIEAEGPVTVYPETFAGRLTASGMAYDPADFVVSHPSLPFGTVVLLTHPRTGHSIFARVIDRGPVDEALLMDVSAAVAQELGMQGTTSAPIELRIPR